MPTHPDPVEQHYTVGDLLERIRAALEGDGKDLSALDTVDLAPVDEFHVRGREATEELAELADIDPDSHVLDVGSGLGGSARFLASEYGCTVAGVDLTPEFCAVASELSSWIGLGDRTEIHAADALDMPFPDGKFDIVWTEHVQMNIGDKPGLCREMERVLRPAGRLVIHEIFSAGESSPHYPVPWANDESVSHLITPERAQQDIEDAGFRTAVWRDMSGVTAEWFRETLATLGQSGPPPVGLHLIMGASAPTKLGNVGRSLAEGSLRVYQGVFEKPA